MNTPLPIRATREDDIANLRQSLRLPQFNYVDFSARREREEALQRWPLLRELDRIEAAGHAAAAERVGA